MRLYESGGYETYQNVPGYPLSYLGSFLRTVPSDGTYTYYTLAVDVVDNEEDAPSTPDVTIVVDTQAPTLSIITPPDGGNIDAMAYYLVQASANDLTSGIKRVNLTLSYSNGTIILSNKNMSLGTSGNYEYLMSMWNLDVGGYVLTVTATDNAGNLVSASSSFTIQANVAPSNILAINSQVPITGGTVSFQFYITERGSNQIRFGMDNIAGLTPSVFNARISNGTTSVPVGGPAPSYTGAGVLTLQDNDLITPNTQGNFTLYLDIPPSMVPGNYPINYYIGIV